MAERLGVGVAARLSRYLQVLAQAKKMGKDRISSQEIAEYTNINATQIRRDLSAFGRFGKRGVGYSVDSLLAEIRKILRTQGQHNIALVGAGRLGAAIASSPIFAEHGITIAAAFDSDPLKIAGRKVHGREPARARNASSTRLTLSKNAGQSKVDISRRLVMTLRTVSFVAAWRWCSTRTRSSGAVPRAAKWSLSHCHAGVESGSCSRRRWTSCTTKAVRMVEASNG